MFNVCVGNIDLSSFICSSARPAEGWGLARAEKTGTYFCGYIYGHPVYVETQCLRLQNTQVLFAHIKFVLLPV